MKISVKQIVRYGFIFSLMLLFQACSLKLPLKSTSESDSAFDVPSKNTEVKEMSFSNGIQKDAKLITGTFDGVIHLEHNGKPLEAYSFIKDAMIRELEARKLPVSIVADAKNAITINKMEIFSYRSSGFSPLVTLSMLKVSVTMNDEEKVFTSIVKRGKVPIWVFDEVFDPCYNEPISIMVKEVVAKINKEYFAYKMSNEYVSKLLVKIDDGINTKDKLNYLNIYELGFSNNDKVIDPLKSFSNSSDEYLRLASIAMLGFVAGESEFDYLVQKYRTMKLWQDRAMAMKAISDINTEKSKKFLEGEYNLWLSQDSKEAKWNIMLLDFLK